MLRFVLLLFITISTCCYGSIIEYSLTASELAETDNSYSYSNTFEFDIPYNIISSFSSISSISVGIIGEVYSLEEYEFVDYITDPDGFVTPITNYILEEEPSYIDASFTLNNGSCSLVNPIRSRRNTGQYKVEEMELFNTESWDFTNINDTITFQLSITHTGGIAQITNIDSCKVLFSGIVPEPSSIALFSAGIVLLKKRKDK